jgi:hypothetical protein
MIGSIENRLDKLDYELDEVVKDLKAQTDQVHVSPEGKWSPAQILHHLYTSEFGTVNYLKKKIEAENVPSAGVRGFLASLLLKRALKNKNKKYKAPKVLGEMPEKPEFEKLQMDFLSLRKELRSVLGRFDKRMAKKAYFKHPVAGRMNIYQTLSFLEDHFDRHKKQIYERLSHGKK